MLSEHRQAFRGRIATVEEQVDHRGVDLPPARGGELAGGELPDLLVGERVVRRLTRGLRQQEASPDRWREIVVE